MKANPFTSLRKSSRPTGPTLGDELRKVCRFAISHSIRAVLAFCSEKPALPRVACLRSPCSILDELTVRRAHWPGQVNKGQEALEKKLGLLETHQKEVHDSLVSIESEAARMYQVRARA